MHIRIPGENHGDLERPEGLEISQSLDIKSVKIRNLEGKNEQTILKGSVKIGSVL